MTLNIDKKLQDKVLKEVIEAFNKKIKKKGTLSFNSPLEGWAKIYEEAVIELGAELHNKHWDKYRTELMDVVITALWGIMSLDVNKSV